MLRGTIWLCVLLGALAVFLRAQVHPCTSSDYNCAVFYVQHQQFSEAIASLSRLLRNSPQDLKALNLLGIAFTEAGQIDKANEAFSLALTVDPHFFPARKNLAVNKFNSKRYEEAATEFNAVINEAT